MSSEDFEVVTHELLCLGQRLLTNDKKGYAFKVLSSDRDTFFLQVKASKSFAMLTRYTIEGDAELKRYWPSSISYEGPRKHGDVTQEEQDAADVRHMETVAHFASIKAKRQQAATEADSRKARIADMTLGELAATSRKLTPQKRNALKLALINYLDSERWIL